MVMHKPFIVIAFFVLLSSCRTTTFVASEPQAAAVYVNGKFVGKTPTTFKTARGLPRRYHLQIFHKDCEPLDMYVDTRLSWGWGIAASLTFIPYLWAYSLDSELLFDLSARCRLVGDDNEESVEP